MDVRRHSWNLSFPRRVALLGCAALILINRVCHHERSQRTQR